jgi:hypothetical protein
MADLAPAEKGELDHAVVPVGVTAGLMEDLAQAEQGKLDLAGDPSETAADGPADAAAGLDAVQLSQGQLIQEELCRDEEAAAAAAEGPVDAAQLGEEQLTQQG